MSISPSVWNIIILSSERIATSFTNLIANLWININSDVNLKISNSSPYDKTRRLVFA